MYAIKRILCPTDFSVHSKNALVYAVSIAQRYGAGITVMHADEFDVSPLGYFNLQDEAVQRYRDIKTKFLKDQLNILAEEYVPDDINVEKIILPGRAYKLIVERAESENFDLIVMARRGTTNLSDHLVGSTAERVVRLARSPVMSIKGTGVPVTEGMRNILCPTDFSSPANAALSYAAALAETYGSKLYILHISEIGSGDEPEDLRQSAPELCDVCAETPDIDIEYVFDRDIEPNNSIIRFADDREIDMIVMSTHGKKGLRRVFIGNNTAEVVRKSECPVLTVTHPVHKMVFSKPATEGAGGK